LALAVVCSLLVFLTRCRWRSWIQGFILHLLIAVLFFTPVLLFNLNHQFTPFLFQWNHMQVPTHFSSVFSFLGNQILILGALPFLLLPWVIFNYRTLARFSDFRVGFFFFAAPLSFFLFKSTHHFLEANWALVAYLSFWTLASYFFAVQSLKFLKWGILILSFSVPVVVSAAICTHLVYPLPLIKIHQDRLSRMKAQETLTREVGHLLRNDLATPIFLPTYQWTSFFRYWVNPRSFQLPHIGRPSHFSLSSPDPCLLPSALFFQTQREPIPPALSCFDKVETVGRFSLTVRGEEIDNFILVKLKQGSSS
jgi:hypothetical protein